MGYRGPSRGEGGYDWAVWRKISTTIGEIGATALRCSRLLTY